ncbi:helix-turn-helix domain-containing protein [Anaerococcus lactolyticus]|uniref:helix-turn-helix domain-containing protein n=1 Tax=Anaerococcus lactolyticus TaxID=33032 RepID=UPI00288BA098|nr:helix-turn-helix transcriptional regulator [Anaerococcus lactolyticus]
MEFKISLKAARVNAGLTILEACEKLGISKDTMIRWEREPWLISAINMDKISKVYNISIDNINFLPEN